MLQPPITSHGLETSMALPGRFTNGYLYDGIVLDKLSVHHSERQTQYKIGGGTLRIYGLLWALVGEARGQG